MKFAGILGFGLLAIVKFLFTPSAMVFAPVEYSFLTIVLTTSTGAAVGVLAFYYFGKQFFRWVEKIGRKKKKKSFTPWRRRIVSVKNKLGLKGLMLISALISVPITSLLASKYYEKQKGTPLYIIVGFAGWSVVLTSLSELAKWAFN